MKGCIRIAFRETIGGGGSQASPLTSELVAYLYLITKEEFSSIDNLIRRVVLVFPYEFVLVALEAPNNGSKNDPLVLFQNTKHSKDNIFGRDC